MRRASSFVTALGLVCLFACGNKHDKPRDGVDSDSHGLPSPAVPPAAPAPGTAAPAVGSSGSAAASPPVAPPVAEAPAGNPPVDGKYERVQIDGITVPMIQVMNSGTIVLVDTDGKKPRTWEEQYKKKEAKLAGQYDLHKTDANHNGKFDDDEVDRQGLWIIDAKGNLTRH